MTVDASPSPEPGREGSLGDAFLPSGLRRIERSPAGGQSRQTAAGQSTGLSGAPPAVGIPNTPPGPRRLHRSVSPHGCAMRHTPPYGNTRSSSPPRDDRSHQSPRPRCAAHAYRTPDERGREADPGRGRRRGRPGATGGTLLLLLGPWSSLSASPGLASSPGGSTHGFLPVGSEGLGVPPVRGLPRTPSTPPPDSAPAGSSRPDVWDLGRPATHTEGGGPISLCFAAPDDPSQFSLLIRWPDSPQMARWHFYVLRAVALSSRDVPTWADSPPKRQPEVVAMGSKNEQFCKESLGKRPSLPGAGSLPTGERASHPVRRVREHPACERQCSAPRVTGLHPAL